MNVFIIVPAYNESQTIAKVISELSALGHTIVVIDDGSGDNTYELAHQSGAIVLRHCVNLGQGAALQTGLEYARKSNADVVVTFDADGQHQVSDIPKLLEVLHDDSIDIVLGSRFLGTTIGMPISRKMLLKVARCYTNLTTGLKLTDVHNGLRALTVSRTMSISLKQNRMAHASEILYQIAEYKLRYKEVPCTIMYTAYSLSKGQNFFHSLQIFSDLFIRRLYK